ncbi:long-chain-alcohol oxidase FAO1-like [Oryza brachyantha]|uniref:long-chain-alcohol oxidase FAO1-like n=1 Tax=Oryza brachyantha TaxID=4533 RepID=UPI001ADC7B29|nr:long-chain-alcohol oxidase FAO1-like [Oryza brachyantha]
MASRREEEEEVKAKKAAAAAMGHPVLRRVRRARYTHGLGAAQMEALRAMCGALVPALPVEQDGARGGDADLERFYLASAAESAVADEVAELTMRRCVWEAGLLVRVVLWMLATRIGTLALCGRPCVAVSGAGGGFPYVRRFADMPVERREEVLRRWNTTRWLFPLKITFALVKILCQFVFYTAMDENSENPCWNAIGYSVPAAEEEPPKEPAEEAPAPAPAARPLDNGVVETKQLDDNTLLRSLAEKGLAVKTSASNAHHTVLCDVVVVGSGCGGGVAAAVLASAGYKVVVVEKGEYFTAKDYSSLEGPSMERLYEQGGVFSTSNVTTTIFAGSTVGGGSAVNWSASIRTPADVLQEWSRDHGLPVFGGPRYVQAMDAVCARLAVTGRCREEGFQNKVVRRGCEALGLRVEAVPRNSSEGHFCGSCNLGCPTGEKRGTDTTWLVDAVERGAVILTGCKAERFILERNTGVGRGKNVRRRKCVGLVATCMSEGVTKKLRIEAKVSISACGALMTPPLLRNSGLRNRHIGRNLHLHPVAMAWGYFPENTPESPLAGKSYEGGIITSMHRVTERTIVETPALGPGAFAALMPWESGRDMKERMRRYARTAHAIVLVRDRAAGTVGGEGRVRFTPLREDAEELRNGLQRALRILVAAGAAEVGTNRSDGLRLRCKGARDEDLEAFLDEVTVEKGPMHPGSDKWALVSSAHQMGSCRMGKSQRDGAVDAAGESWEAEGLYVCDGSLLPTAVGVNPMITIESVAYCVSKGIADSLAR